MADEENKVPDEDYILLGKLFVDVCAHKGMPLTPEAFSENKPKIAKAIGTTEDKLLDVYQLLFSLSMESSLGSSKRNAVGFKKV